MRENLVKMQNKLKKHLDPPRYTHTLGVMHMAGVLALKYSIDLEQALIAGLLHDCAKCIPSEKKLRLCKEYHIPVSEVEQENPGLLHAKLGMYIAKESYHIKDPEILSAIACHTTGKPEMSSLDKIIYIADYIEPGRGELPNMELVRMLAFKNLDECFYKILEDSLGYLESRGIPLDPMTREAYEYYTNKFTKEI